MKVRLARATLEFSNYYEESIQQMVNDGELKTEKEISDYIKTCLIEDLTEKAKDILGMNQLKLKITCDIDLDMVGE